MRGKVFVPFATGSHEGTRSPKLYFCPLFNAVSRAYFNSRAKDVNSAFAWCAGKASTPSSIPSGISA